MSIEWAMVAINNLHKINICIYSWTLAGTLQQTLHVILNEVTYSNLPEPNIASFMHRWPVASEESEAHQISTWKELRN